jgi:hypothetical protein
MFNVAITYRGKTGRPLIVATIADKELLSLAAEAAIVEAEQDVNDLSRQDPVLGAIQALEVEKLKRVLDILAMPVGVSATGVM